jgi:hypothetical protein
MFDRSLYVVPGTPAAQQQRNSKAKSTLRVVLFGADA